MTVDLRATLPAGEWADVQILTDAVGMMASGNWAIFAKAKRIRAGGQAAFIKFVVAAGAHAGHDTLLVTGDGRLRGLAERLQEIKLRGDSIPIVPLLEVQHMQNGLLIAMEEVTPLRELIDGHRAYHLSARVLQDLDPETVGQGWHHFDICPNNIGVLRDERCVLIDVESCYLETDGKYNISVPAWKGFRAPRELVRDVQNQLPAGEIDAPLASRKLRYEVALAAAECVLGSLPCYGVELTRSTVESWVAHADVADPAVAFWKREVLLAIENADFPPLRELRTGLAAALTSDGASRGESPSSPTSLGPTEGTESTGMTSEPPHSSAQSEWFKEWILLKPMIHALRAGRLGRQEISEYRQSLRQLAYRYPTEIDVWNELLLVVISFEKDRVLALSLVNEALTHIPGDEGLSRTKNIIQMWARERRHGNHDAE